MEEPDKTMIAGLTAENKQLTSELFEVNERLKEAEAFKSHFISNITNEIVNPFASILALSEDILSLESTEMEQAKKMAALIHKEAFHLDFQLKNVFAAAMIEAGAGQIMPVSVNLIDLLQQAIHFFRQEIDQKQLEIDLQVKDQEEPGLVRSFLTDAGRIELIVKNLLSNAIKFSNHRGKIAVSAETKRKKLTLIVRDFGKGIPQEETKHIFDRFKQLDQSTNTLNTGQGLGLSIVGALIADLDGNIALATPEDGGLEVKLEIGELSLADEECGSLDDFLLDREEKF